MSDDRTNHPTPPPPQKRIKSADLYRAQHGISPDRERDSTLKDMQPLLAAAAAHHLRDRERGSDRSRERERNRSLDHSRSRDSSLHERERDRSSSDLRDSLLGQALEGGPTLLVPSVQFTFFSFCFFFAFLLLKKRKQIAELIRTL